MKILLFGTGDYYQKYKSWFKDEDILGLVDNDEGKRGTKIDGHRVYIPKEAIALAYDCVVILSVHEASMRAQLLDLGVPDDRIYKFSDLHKYPEMIVADRSICFWGDDESFAEILLSGHRDIILLMSHNLDLNGAALALFYLAKILKRNGFPILFVSWSDGKLRRYLYEEGIAVVIDPNLQVRTQKETRWIQGYHRIICNTLNYYQFLSDRNLENKIIWWLHDHRMFYESLDLELLHKIKDENLTVCAVSKIAEDSFREYFPTYAVRHLLYGIPDVDCKKIPHEKLEIIMIGNVQEYKGQEILIEALKLLDREISGRIHVNIVGFRPSAYANRVKEKAEELGEMIDFIPPSDRKEIHGLLDGADILVCPSRIDTMSIVTNEGMMHKMVCIVSDATGVARYITDGVDGFIVKQGDVWALAEKIIWCVKNRGSLEKIGRAARRVYEQYFSMEVFERNLLEIVEEVF